MDAAVVQRLVALNHQFYQTFAVQFDLTRQRLQPGVRRLLETGRFGKRLLDVGCGNGELARALSRHAFSGQYTGIDFSPALLESARHGQPPTFTTVFYVQDIAEPDWQLPPQEPVFDTIAAFAVLHHIPGSILRRRILTNIRSRLAPAGEFILSNWQFLNSPRLVKRIQPWKLAGLQETDVDLGDYLLDWRSGGTGLRYVHAFNESDLASLAAETGFTVQESFYSDGETGDLSLYQVWRPSDLL